MVTKTIIYLLGDLVLDGVALLTRHRHAEILQPVEALLLRHLGGEGSLHGLALLAGNGLALLPVHRHTLLPRRS